MPITNIKGIEINIDPSTKCDAKPAQQTSFASAAVSTPACHGSSISVSRSVKLDKFIIFLVSSIGREKKKRKHYKS